MIFSVNNTKLRLEMQIHCFYVLKMENKGTLSKRFLWVNFVCFLYSKTKSINIFYENTFFAQFDFYASLIWECVNNFDGLRTRGGYFTYRVPYNKNQRLNNQGL